MGCGGRTSMKLLKETCGSSWKLLRRNLRRYKGGYSSFIGKRGFG
jgi:ATPase subunit of ABC transporter with duplicated ATPase domains